MLRNKVALITGASRGIGREIAFCYAKNGADLALIARELSALERLRDEIALETGTSPLLIRADLGQLDTIDNVVTEAIRRFQTIDVLVNAAGTISRSLIQDLDFETHLSIFNVNVHAPIFLARACIPYMASHRGGSIINITSQMARVAHPNAAVSYESSKAALAAATRHLAFHHAKDNIRVNSIAPGSIETDMLKSMSPSSLETLRAKIPLGRFGETSDVANAALFLATDLSSYITGSTIDVNGGSWMI